MWVANSDTVAHDTIGHQNRRTTLAIAAHLNWEFQGPWSHYCINCNMCIIHRRSVPRISDRTLAIRPGERLYMDVTGNKQSLRSLDKKALTLRFLSQHIRHARTNLRIPNPTSLPNYNRRLPLLG